MQYEKTTDDRELQEDAAEVLRGVGDGFPHRRDLQDEFTDLEARIDDTHIVEVLNLALHVEDGTDVVQVNLWVDRGGRPCTQRMVAHVTEVPNDVETMRAVVLLLVGSTVQFGDRPSALRCDYDD